MIIAIVANSAILIAYLKKREIDYSDLLIYGFKKVKNEYIYIYIIIIEIINIYK